MEAAVLKPLHFVYLQVKDGMKLMDQQQLVLTNAVFSLMVEKNTIYHCSLISGDVFFMVTLSPVCDAMSYTSSSDEQSDMFKQY